MPAQITGYEYEVEACLRDLQQGNPEPVEMPHAQTKMLLHQMDALRAIWHIKFPFEDKSPFTDMALIALIAGIMTRQAAYSKKLAEESAAEPETQSI